MNDFVVTEPHQSTMARIDGWCDEATFIDWEQGTAELPSWQGAYERLVAEGQAASLTNPTPAHQSRSFPAPIESS